MQSLLFITMLLTASYSQCNESNWEEYYPNLQGCDLFGANLTGANLTEANFFWANLEGAYLPFANLYMANLTEVDFTSASCYGAFFVNSIIDETDFNGAYLGYAYFDKNIDGYDDVSYNAGATSGDLNLDGEDNILDIVELVNQILNP